MLGQSMAFYADEFAGRITTKIMQTALAVRDMIFTTTDVVVGMGVYLITILLLAWGFDWRLCCRLRAGWCATAWCAGTLCPAWARSAATRPTPAPS